MELLKRFEKNWAQKRFAASEHTTLLAVSGGVDSMIMADLFLRSGLKFAIAHCNFQLRGAEANKDEELVGNWAQLHNIPFHSARFDTKQKSEEWKKGIQETARILRYEWLDIIREEHKYRRLATAHHANDNAETLLINLFKGTGIAGLHGIPEQNDHIIRPLLFASKQDILAYAQSENIPYREDASNAKDDYLRNAVRLNIIPTIDKHFPNVVQHLNDSITRFAETEILYKKIIEQERKKLLEKRGNDYYIPVLRLKHREALQTICYELCMPFGFTPAQVPHIVQLIESESGHYINSPTHRIIRNRDFLIITAIPTQHTDLILIEGFPCTIETEHYKFHFSVEKKPEKISADNTIALIDMKRVVLPLTLRKWRIGDYFYPLGMGMKKKKLSKYFIDQKVPLHEKDRTWVLESDKRIAWVAGMRLDERFKIIPATHEVLRVSLKG
jgi:tRNA(Ile)-lysidine synthase